MSSYRPYFSWTHKFNHCSTVANSGKLFLSLFRFCFIRHGFSCGFYYICGYAVHRVSITCSNNHYFHLCRVCNGLHICGSFFYGCGYRCRPSDLHYYIAYQYSTRFHSQAGIRCTRPLQAPHSHNYTTFSKWFICPLCALIIHVEHWKQSEMNGSI